MSARGGGKGGRGGQDDHGRMLTRFEGRVTRPGDEPTFFHFPMSRTDLDTIRACVKPGGPISSSVGRENFSHINAS